MLRRRTEEFTREEWDVIDAKASGCVVYLRRNGRLWRVTNATWGERGPVTIEMEGPLIELKDAG